MRYIAALFLAIILGLSAPVFAQDGQPDYTAWEKLANQAEQIVQSNQANDARLQAIRTEVVRWRDRFGSSESTNSTRIATLKDQIAALGPVPAEGATESPDIASRREELNNELAELQAPGIKAVESYGRADGIVQQIDRTLRERQANALLRLTPTPLNPANWGPALKDGLTIVVGIYDEVGQNWTRIGGLNGLREALPALVALLLGAIFFLGKGRRWVDDLPERLSKRSGQSASGAVNFLVSLFQILMPWVGVVLAAMVLQRTALFGEWATPLIRNLAPAGLAIFGGAWIARRMFPKAATGITPPVAMLEAERKRARVRGSLLAAGVALHQLFGPAILPLSGFHASTQVADAIPLRMSDASAGVWNLPLILIGAFCLFQLCQVLRRAESYDPSEAGNYRIHLLIYLGKAGRVVAVIAPVLAIVGYVTAANALLWPMSMTLALVSLLILLQDFVADLYSLIKGGDGEARNALLPLLIGMALIALSLPFFALIWGARGSDLGEAWVRAQNGFSLGGMVLSPMALLTFLIVFVIGYSLTRFMQGAFRNTILPKTKIDAGGQNAIVSGLGYVGVGLAALLAVSTAGIDLSSLAIVAGALSVGIGFGMQQVVSNFVSGIILLIERPITVGDWIDVGGKQGIVKRMSVRATQIQTFDRTDVIVPNSDLITQPVTNWTRGNLSGRIIVPVGVAYGSDTRHVSKVLQEIAEDQPTVLINPAPFVVFKGFGADALNFEIRAILSDINGGTGVTSEMNHQIAERFAKEGIEMPFPQRDIWLRNPEALIPRPDAAPVKTAPTADADDNTDDAATELPRSDAIAQGK